MNAATREPIQGEVPSGIERRLWFGILAAPSAWTVNEITSYAIAAQACTRDEFGLLGWLGVAGLGSLAALVSLVAGFTAWSVFRDASGGASIAKSEGWGRVEFMAMAGVFISVLLLLNIIYFTIMPLLIDPCLRVT